MLWKAIAFTYEEQCKKSKSLSKFKIFYELNSFVFSVFYELRN